MKEEQSTVSVQRDSSPYDVEISGNPDVVAEKKGTTNDQKEMYRMGKPQELRVWLTRASLHQYEPTANCVFSETSDSSQSLASP